MIAAARAIPTESRSEGDASPAKHCHKTAARQRITGTACMVEVAMSNYFSMDDVCCTMPSQEAVDPILRILLTYLIGINGL